MLIFCLCCQLWLQATAPARSPFTPQSRSHVYEKLIGCFFSMYSNLYHSITHTETLTEKQNQCLPLRRDGNQMKSCECTFLLYFMYFAYTLLMCSRKIVYLTFIPLLVHFCSIRLASDVHWRVDWLEHWFIDAMWLGSYVGSPKPLSGWIRLEIHQSPHICYLPIRWMTLLVGRPWVCRLRHSTVITQISCLQRMRFGIFVEGADVNTNKLFSSWVKQ